MKKIVQGIGLCSLICFSFMYTDKVMEVISEQDSLMIEIEEKKDDYKIDKLEAIIENNTIIPGQSGREVDTKKSYNKMHELGIFREDLLVYNSLPPQETLINNLDKFIISGNPQNKKISIIFKITSNTDPNNLNIITTKYQIPLNIFIDNTYLMNNLNSIKKINNIELYNYGDNGIYTQENILTINNVINNRKSNKSTYCLSEDQNPNILELCSKNKMNTITPTIIGNNNPYNNIKTNLKNGSIISLDVNKNTINELPNIIEFIKGKGLNIVNLSDLLNEYQIK